MDGFSTFYLDLVMLILVLTGSKLLINELLSILDGSAKDKAQPQDDSKATLAPKVSIGRSRPKCVLSYATT